MKPLLHLKAFPFLYRYTDATPVQPVDYHQHQKYTPEMKRTVFYKCMQATFKNHFEMLLELPEDFDSDEIKYWSEQPQVTVNTNESQVSEVIRTSQHAISFPWGFYDIVRLANLNDLEPRVINGQSAVLPIYIEHNSPLLTKPSYHHYIKTVSSAEVLHPMLFSFGLNWFSSVPSSISDFNHV